jgi:hypothetical protein
MTEKKRRFIYWMLKGLSIIVACAFPVWAVYEKYPLWTIEHGTVRSIGTGGILILFVLIIIFRRTVFDFFRDRLKLKYAPPLFIWLVLLLISYALLYVSKFLYDITTVFWMGLIGCAIGTLLTFIAENVFNKESGESDGA